MDKLLQIWRLPKRDLAFFCLKQDNMTEAGSRGHILRQIHNILKTEPHTTLVGLSGTGKTSLAVEYAYSKSGEYDHIFFTHGENFIEHLKEILQSQKNINPDKLNLEEIVFHLFFSTKQTNLLIIDNVNLNNEIRDILYHLHSSNNKVILTSNSQHWFNAINVPSFTHNESLALMKNHFPKEPLNDLEKLIDSLGNLPLAMMQAISYLKSTKSTIQEYLAIFKNHPDRLLQKSGINLWKHNYPYSAYKALQLTLDKIKKKDENCATLLNYCAIFHYENIPKRLLSKLIGSEIILNDLLIILLEFSLVWISDDRKSINIHCLLHKLISLNLTKDTKQSVIHHALSTIHKNYFYNRNEHALFREAILFLPHFEKILKISSEYIDSCNDIFKYHILLLISIGCYESYEKHNTTSAKIKFLTAEKLVEDNTNIININQLSTLYNGLGHHYHLKNNHEKSLNYHQKVIYLQPDKPELYFYAEIGIATAYCNLNETKEAIKIAEKTLNNILQQYQTHIDIPHLLYRSALIYYQQNNIDICIEHSLKAISIGKSLFKDGFNFDSAGAAELLGNIYQNKPYNDFEKSLSYYEYALAVFEKLIGTERHETIINLKKNIRAISEKLGKKTQKITILINNKQVKLTPKEYKYLKLIRQGLSSKIIAKKLNLSPRTIETHIDNIKSKCACGTKLELVAMLANTEFVESTP